MNENTADNEQPPSEFSVATFNVLATAYANHAWYRRTPSIVLDPAWRVPVLARYIAGLRADLLCLQEVEPDVFATLRATLAASGYEVHYARKGGNRPDGLALLYRKQRFALVKATRLLYADAINGAPASGYIALFAWLRAGGRILGVINTHLSWDPPENALQTRIGYCQAGHLLAEYQKLAGSADAWIIGGDLNVTPADALTHKILGAQFAHAHRDIRDAATCNVNGEARMIDYLFHSSALRAEPEAIPPIDSQTVLPSAAHPSDHVPVAARFTWYT